MSDVATIVTCRHPRCQTSIPDYRIACPGHWNDLPASFRRAYQATRSNLQAHGAAITAILVHWARQVEETERLPRCHNCKAESLGTDSDGLAWCPTCAKASVPGSAVPLRCDRCGKTTDQVGILISVDTGEGFGPDLCPHCQIQEAR